MSDIFKYPGERGEITISPPEVTVGGGVAETQEKDFELNLTLQRLERHLELGEMIDRLEAGEMPSTAERAKLANIIEGRGWNALFRELHEGDRVAVFIVPGGPYSIKHLNDDIFGPQGADAIIDHQKKILREEMEAHGATPLKQDYKTGIIKLEAMPRKMVDAITVRVNSEMDDFIQKLIASRLNELRAKGEPTEMLEQFRERCQKETYTLSFGLSTVGMAYHGTGDNSHVELAVLEGLQASKINQLSGADAHGREYNKQQMFELVDTVAALPEKIITASGNVLMFGSVTYSPIFTADSEYGYHINPDVLRALRKGTLVPPAEEKKLSDRQREVIFNLEHYRQLINVLDVVKPYTHEEIAGNPSNAAEQTIFLQSLLDEELGLAATLRDPEWTLDRETLQSIARVLKRDQKDTTCTSPAVFHSEALRMEQEDHKRCTYICIDVLDVGIDLLVEYEEAFRAIHQTESANQDVEMQNMSMVVGDMMTKRLRAIRANIRTFCEQQLGLAEVPLLVGGDEVTLALPSDQVTDNFLFGLRAATGSRVVTAQVRRAPVETFHVDELRKRHAAALKNAERGVHLAKQIEEALRERRLGRFTSPDAAKPALSSLFADLAHGFVVKEAHEDHGQLILTTVHADYPLIVEGKRITTIKNGERLILFNAFAILALLFFVWR